MASITWNRCNNSSTDENQNPRAAFILISSVYNIDIICILSLNKCDTKPIANDNT